MCPQVNLIILFVNLTVNSLLTAAACPLVPRKCPLPDIPKEHIEIIQHKTRLITREQIHSSLVEHPSFKNGFKLTFTQVIFLESGQNRSWLPKMDGRRRVEFNPEFHYLFIFIRADESKERELTTEDALATYLESAFFVTEISGLISKEFLKLKNEINKDRQLAKRCKETPKELLPFTFTLEMDSDNEKPKNIMKSIKQFLSKILSDNIDNLFYLTLGLKVRCTYSEIKSSKINPADVTFINSSLGIIVWKKIIVFRQRKFLFLGRSPHMLFFSNKRWKHRFEPQAMSETKKGKLMYNYYEVLTSSDGILEEIANENDYKEDIASRLDLSHDDPNYEPLLDSPYSESMAIYKSRNIVLSDTGVQRIFSVENICRLKEKISRNQSSLTKIFEIETENTCEQTLASEHLPQQSSCTTFQGNSTPLSGTHNTSDSGSSTSRKQWITISDGKRALVVNHDSE